MINFVSIHKIDQRRGRSQPTISLPNWIYEQLGILKSDEHNRVLLEGASEAPGVVRLRLPSKREKRLANESRDTLMLYLNDLWDEDEDYAVELDETFAELQDLHDNDPAVLDDSGFIVPYPYSRLTKRIRETLDCINVGDVVTYDDIIAMGMSRGWVLRFFQKCEKYGIMAPQEPIRKPIGGRPTKRWKRVPDIPKKETK